jgi:hypothetical protein
MSDAILGGPCALLTMVRELAASVAGTLGSRGAVQSPGPVLEDSTGPEAVAETDGWLPLVTRETA